MSCPIVQAAPPLANYVIKGEVTDKSGEAIIGASVLEKGYNKRYYNQYRWEIYIDCTK